jgi:hypothetical protein
MVQVGGDDKIYLSLNGFWKTQPPKHRVSPETPTKEVNPYER